MPKSGKAPAVQLVYRRYVKQLSNGKWQFDVKQSKLVEASFGYNFNLADRFVFAIQGEKASMPNYSVGYMVSNLQIRLEPSLVGIKTPVCRMKGSPPVLVCDK